MAPKSKTKITLNMRVHKVVNKTLNNRAKQEKANSLLNSNIITVIRMTRLIQDLIIKIDRKVVTTDRRVDITKIEAVKAGTTDPKAGTTKIAEGTTDRKVDIIKTVAAKAVTTDLKADTTKTVVVTTDRRVDITKIEAAKAVTTGLKADIIRIAAGTIDHNKAVTTDLKVAITDLKAADTAVAGHKAAASTEAAADLL